MAVLERPRPDPELADPGRYEIRPRLGLIVLTTLAAPLWLLGCLAGVVSVAVLWVMAAVALGWSDARATLRRR